MIKLLGLAKINLFNLSSAVITLNIPTYYPNSVWTFRLILICGDIHISPSPETRSNGKCSNWKYTSVECSKPVKNNQDGILCVDCSRWFHAKCVGISRSMFRKYYIQHPEVGWSCVNGSVCNFSDSFFADIQGEGNYGNRDSCTSYVNQETNKIPKMFAEENILNASLDNDNGPGLEFLFDERKRHPDDPLIIHLNINGL